MLLIDHYVGTSKIHGLGVFSAQDVKKGELIWQFNDVIDREIEEERLLDLPLHVVAKIHRHAWHRPERNCFWLAADGDYFMNHSDFPTLHCSDSALFAAQDFTIGDELTCDYRVVKVLDYDPEIDVQIKLVSAG